MIYDKAPAAAYQLPDDGEESRSVSAGAPLLPFENNNLGSEYAIEDGKDVLSKFVSFCTAQVKELCS